MSEQYRESLSITTNREPLVVTDQPNVEPPAEPELGITLKQALGHLGGPVEYVAPRPGGDDPAFVERGRIYRVDSRSTRTQSVFVLFENSTTPKLTPLDRLRRLPCPEQYPAGPGHVPEEMNDAEIAEWAVRNEGPDDEPDSPNEDTLGQLTGALMDAGPITWDEAAELAKVALEWLKGRFVAAATSPAAVTTRPTPDPPAFPAAPPQFAPQPAYPQWWGEMGGYSQGGVGAPSLAEQYAALPAAEPFAVGNLVVFRAKPADAALLAIVVGTTPGRDRRISTYNVRLPHLGTTQAAYQDQLSAWHQPEPDF